MLQGYLIQGAANQAAGGLSISCGGGTGVFTTGNCTQSFSITGTSLSGTVLVPGSATYRHELTHNGVLVDFKTTAVTLVP